MRKLNPVNKYVSNVELEKGEVLLRPNEDSFDLVDIGGKLHSKGGTYARLGKGDRVFSSKIKLPEQLVSALIGTNKKISPADLAKKYSIDRYNDILKNSTDPISKKSAELMIAKNSAMLESIFDAQEMFKETRGVKDGVLLKDQGKDANLDSAAMQVGGRTPIGFAYPGFKPMTLGYQDEKNNYLNLYTAPDRYALNPNGQPRDPSYWQKDKKNRWFTKPEHTQDVLDQYADQTGYNRVTNTYNTDELSQNRRKALVLNPKNNVSNTFSSSYVPTFGTRDASGNFTPQYKTASQAKGYADPRYDKLPAFDPKMDVSKMDVEFFPAKGVDKNVKNAFADKSNAGNYDDIRTLSMAYPRTQPPARPAITHTEPLAPKPIAQPVSETPNDLKINPAAPAAPVAKAPNADMAQLIGFKEEQKNIQSNLLASILGRVAPPVYTNPQSPVLDKRFLPINDLAAERSVNNARDSMMRTGMPSQYINNMSGDLTAKAVEGSGKVDIANYQGYNQVLNENTANRQNTIYKNRVNDEEAKRNYVMDWQKVLDQKDKETQDQIYAYQDLNVRKAQSQDDATLKEHLYRAAGKKFIPKAKFNRNGTVDFQYLSNPNWTPAETSQPWYAQSAQQDYMKMNPEDRKALVEYLKATRASKAEQSQG